MRTVVRAAHFPAPEHRRTAKDAAMTTPALEAPPELAAELAALQQLAARHRREFVRLRTIELSKLTGTPVRFTRDRLTAAQLAELPPVTDADGGTLVPGARVRCPDGVRGTVVRVDRRSRRCVVERADGTSRMVVARRLTAARKRTAHAA